MGEGTRRQAGSPIPTLSKVWEWENDRDSVNVVGERRSGQFSDSHTFESVGMVRGGVV